MQTIAVRETCRSIIDIMAYENAPVLDRYIRDFGGSREDAARRFQAMKQFLVVCAVGRGAKVPNDNVDDMWHTFLLFTREYGSFCEEYLGRFIHHQPFGGFPPETYTQTRARALEIFDSLDEEFWPMNAKTDCGSGASSGCP